MRRSSTTASTWVNQQLGFYGAAQNRISAAIDLRRNSRCRQKTNLSNLQDTTSLELRWRVTQLTTALNAAMAAQAKRPTSTLFDYYLILADKRVGPDYRASQRKVSSTCRGIFDMTSVWQAHPFPASRM